MEKRNSLFSNLIDLDKYGISAFGLKLIAVITMIIDHCGVMFATGNKPLYLIMRSIGRISFPLFCFLLVEGFYHTRSKVKHIITLAIFAIISEVPYDAFSGTLFNIGRQSVMFTLLIGFGAIWALDSIFMCTNKETGERIKRVDTNFFDTFIALIILFGGMGLTAVLNTSYSFAGFLLIVFFYISYNSIKSRIILNGFFNMAFYNFGIQWFGTLSIIPIELYNGKLGKYKWKFFFYMFYPVHLGILVLIKLYMIR